MENCELIRQDYLKLEKAFLEVCGEKDLPEYRERIAAYVLRVLSADPVYHKECEDVLALVLGGTRHTEEEIREPERQRLPVCWRSSTSRSAS